MSVAAWADYRSAATASGVEVRPLHADECPAAAALLADLWGGTPMQAALLIAMEHAGSYVAGAFDPAAGAGEGAALVGVCVGFFGAPADATMHSHIAGVSRGTARRGVGTAMKLHQRAWCLDRGVSTMTWTFDPLVARNAAFNVRRLGAALDEYLVDFYGVMTDGVNAGQGSDRVLARWDLNAPLPATPREPGEAPVVLAPGKDDAPAVAPLPPAAASAVIAVPTDIEALRADRPDVAAAWRLAARDAMRPLWDAGWSVTAVGRDGRYLMEAP